MKYKTLFRLGQKLVGLLVIGQGAGSLLSVLAMWFMWYQHGAFSTFGSTEEWYVSFAQPVVEVGVGLYLLLGGRWIADLAIPSNRSYCHECGYDLTGSVGVVCAECGTAFGNPADNPSAVR